MPASEQDASPEKINLLREQFRDEVDTVHLMARDARSHMDTLVDYLHDEAFCTGFQRRDIDLLLRQMEQHARSVLALFDQAVQAPDAKEI